ncbi:MAG: BON domain-containing protein [Rhodocyclaceae bacterium]|jgi:osmotically-inducible protein OsmY|nr:BON domain-containing protein [Rhodocyclaceae bacterium]MDP2108549.1 BON domain-containing protein [Rhodocyclaceae bacterium]MDP2196491.1 BON domain-containing protein [Rhodocyclaceae bacterium]
MKLITQARTLILLAVLAPFLAGCFGVAAVGVGAGALVFADRRQAETIATDQGIEIRASSRISEKFGNRVHVNVTSYNRTVLLTGEVPDAAAKAEIEKIVAEVPNVKAISNELRLGVVSTLTQRSGDTFITSKVKARFIDANQFAANHVKVVTESSVVYLMGLATQREASAAVEIARTTAGVQKVVRVFEIISDAEARRLDPPPSKPAAQ